MKVDLWNLAVHAVYHAARALDTLHGWCLDRLDDAVRNENPVPATQPTPRQEREASRG